MKKIFIVIIILTVTLMGQNIYTDNDVQYEIKTPNGIFRGLVFDKKTIQPITGILKKYHDKTGILISYTEYKNGKMHGLSRSYYDSGTLKSETHYIDGKENGSIKFYFKSGKLSAKGYKKDNWYDGLYIAYDISGHLSTEIKYKNGIEVYKRTYYKTGTIKMEVKYKEQMEVHKTIYDEDGNVRNEWIYGVMQPGNDPFELKIGLGLVIYYIQYSLPEMITDFLKLCKHNIEIVSTSIISVIFFFIFLLGPSFKFKILVTLLPSVLWITTAWMFYDIKTVNDQLGYGLGMMFIYQLLPVVTLISILCIAWVIKAPKVNE